MSDNPEKQQQESDQVESWISRNISPILALVTVILTFIMFGVFIYVIMFPPEEEIKAVAAAEGKYEKALQVEVVDSTRQAISNAAKGKLSKIDSTRQTGGQNLKEDLRFYKNKVVYAKTALKEKQDQRTMVKDIMLYILGVLSSILTSIFSYYFGSSKSSSQKNDTLNMMVKNAGH